MKTAVIIASRDAELLDLCLRAHRRFTPPGVQFFVIGTGDLSAVQAVCEAADDRLIVRGDAAAAGDLTYSQWNADGAEAALDQGADLLVFQNDDSVVTPDWLPTMEQDFAAILASGNAPGALGACSNAISGPQACIGSGGRRGNGVLWVAEGEGKVRRLPFKGPVPCAPVYSFFMAVPAAAYRACGGWDTELPTHCGSDDVLSARMVAAGFSLWMSRAFVCHFGSETLRGQKVDMAAEGRAFREYAHAKYPGAFDADGRWIGGTGVKA